MFSRLFLFVLVILQGAAAPASDYRVEHLPLTRKNLRLHLQRLSLEEAPDENHLLLVHG